MSPSPRRRTVLCPTSTVAIPPSPHPEGGQPICVGQPSAPGTTRYNCFASLGPCDQVRSVRPPLTPDAPTVRSRYPATPAVQQRRHCACARRPVEQTGVPRFVPTVVDRRLRRRRGDPGSYPLRPTPPQRVPARPALPAPDWSGRLNVPEPAAAGLARLTAEPTPGRRNRAGHAAPIPRSRRRSPRPDVHSVAAVGDPPPTDLPRSVEAPTSPTHPPRDAAIPRH